MRNRLRAWGSGLLVAGVSATFLSGGQALAMAGADPVPDGSLPFVAKVSFGDIRACTGALVDSRWIVTAKACFFDGTTPVAAGPPSHPATVVLGHADVTTATGNRLAVTSLVPRPDRDIVLAQLSAPVRDIAPVAIDGGAPQAGETLRIAGYGRTATEWVPDRMHAGTFTVGTVSEGGFTVDGASAGATLCKGDAGGPAFRDTDSGPQLVGISSTSGQKGCLAEAPGTSEGGESRTDDLADWIRTSTAVAPDGLLQPVTGEFTRDGRQDLIAKDAAGSLWLYPGTATPNVWAHRISIGTGWQDYKEFAVGRVNRDTYDDLITIQTATGKLWMYPGTATGGRFGPRVQIGDSGWSTDYRDLTIGKVDRDAYDDLLTVQISTGKLRLYKGTAAGGPFAAPVDDGTGWACCTKLALGKFTSDDYDDLVATDTTGKVRLYAGTAAGTTFAAAVDSGAGTGWTTNSYVTGGRFDGTGLDGLLAVDSTTGSTTLHPRTSTGGWADPVAPGGTVYAPQPYDLRSLVTGEFNRDAYPDLIGADPAGALWLYPGTAAHTFGTRINVGSGWQDYKEFAVGRVNRDTYDDLITIQTATGKLWMYPGTATGGRFGPRVQIGDSGWSTDYRDLTIGKVDRDAYDDLLTVQISTGKLRLYKGTAAGGPFAAPVDDGTGWGCCSQLSVGEFTNDDYDDMFAADSTGKLRLYAGTAAGTTFAPSVDSGAGTGWDNRTELTTIGGNGLLAKDSTGALLAYAAGPDGKIDWSRPTAFGPRD